MTEKVDKTKQMHTILDNSAIKLNKNQYFKVKQMMKNKLIRRKHQTN